MSQDGNPQLEKSLDKLITCLLINLGQMCKCQRNHSCIFAGQICNLCRVILEPNVRKKHCVSYRVLVCTMWIIMGRVCLVACFLPAVEIVTPTVWWTAAIGKTWQLRRRMSSAVEALHMLHTEMLTLEGWSTVSTYWEWQFSAFLFIWVPNILGFYIWYTSVSMYLFLICILLFVLI